MVVLQRNLDRIRREMVKWSEENVDGVLQQAGEKLGKARFAAYGKNTYPDATFTLRLSYGQVKGYPMNGTKAPYKTTLYGLYDRAQSFDFKGPFALPSRYVAGRDKLDFSTPVDFFSTNDIKSLISVFYAQVDCFRVPGTRAQRRGAAASRLRRRSLLQA